MLGAGSAAMVEFAAVLKSVFQIHGFRGIIADVDCQTEIVIAAFYRCDRMVQQHLSDTAALK